MVFREANWKNIIYRRDVAFRASHSQFQLPEFCLGSSFSHGVSAECWVGWARRLCCCGRSWWIFWIHVPSILLCNICWWVLKTEAIDFSSVCNRFMPWFGAFSQCNDDWTSFAGCNCKQRDPNVQSVSSIDCFAYDGRCRWIQSSRRISRIWFADRIDDVLCSFFLIVSLFRCAVC